MIRDAKGNQDRITMLPKSITEQLQAHLVQVKQTHQNDLALGYGAVHLPDALARKAPHADRQWIWQYVFPAQQRSIC